MSSESEDDLYTNSASILKAFKRKLSDPEKIPPIIKEVLLDPPVKNNNIDLTKANIKVVNLEENNSNDDKMIIDLTSEQHKNHCSNVSVHEVNIISTIDSLLAKGKKGKKRSKVQTRSKRKLRSGTMYVNDSPEQTNDPIEAIEVSSTSEDFNYEVTVKVYWKSVYIQKFDMKRFEKMIPIFKFFSEKEKISEDRLLFTFKDKIISKTDTPDTLDIKAGTIIEGGIISEEVNLRPSRKPDKDLILLKIQCQARKHPFEIKIKNTDEMKVLMYKCSEELKIPLNKLKFYFDGDRIRGTDTPSSLEIENGECIDCVLS